MNRRLFFLSRLARVLWLRASLFAGIAVSAALLAHEIGPLVPTRWIEFVGQDPVEELLKVMASSMLAVATFSLTALVAAYGSVTTNASPRAAALLLEDKSAQNALSSFIGAFIFSIVGLVALGTGFFDGPSRFVLFLETLVVLGLVVLRLLGWIDQVSRMGRVGAAIDQVEKALKQSLIERHPFLGAEPAGPGPPRGEPIRHVKVGYVQHVDVAHIDRLAQAHRWRIHVVVLPRSFLRLSRPALVVEGSNSPISDEQRTALLKGVVVGDKRTFQQDPRFGLVVLSEIASRALSPALNDPGTAFDVIGTASRVLSVWGEDHWEEEHQAEYRNVTVPGLSAADCFEDVFAPIERDGAGFLEVGVALQKTFADFVFSPAPGFADAARAHAKRALARAERAISFEDDLDRLRSLAKEVEAKLDAAPQP